MPSSLRRPALLLLCSYAVSRAQRSLSITGSTLRILHLSDAHFAQASPCLDMDVDQVAKGACSSINTTNLLRSAIAIEQPDLIIFTGDVVEKKSDPLQAAMDEVYGVAVEAGIPFAASLGNHEDGLSMSRTEIAEYVAAKKGALSQLGPVAGSPGNFYVDLVPPSAASSQCADAAAAAQRSGGKGQHALDAPCAEHALAATPSPAARLVFFDSRKDDVAHSINNAQLDWYGNLTATLPRVPTIALFHLPLPEYARAAGGTYPPPPANRTLRGFRGEIRIEKPNAAVFPALYAGGVVATFCGHDHQNDFCKEYEGVQLCYTGVSGFNAFGLCTNEDDANFDDEIPTDGKCMRRRVKMTELQFGSSASDETVLQSIRSWKRLDGGASVATSSRVGERLLWSAAGGASTEGERLTGDRLQPASVYSHRPSS